MYRSFDPSYGFVLIEQGPLLLVTVGDKSASNVFCLSWSMALNFDSGNRNVAISTGPWNRSYEFIRKTGRLTLNVPVGNQLKKAVLCGSVSFDDCPDKFKAFGLKTLKGKKNPDVPIIQGCAGYLECEVDKIDEENSILFLNTLAVGLDPVRFRQPKIHAVGDGTFTVDGTLVNGRAYMGGKIPSNTDRDGYLAFAKIPKRSRKL